MTKYPKIFLVIFLCSFASLAYEITLIRIFSIALWYHFAFMIISIAMLGIGASGTLMSLFPKLKDISHINLYSLLLGISISLSYLFSNQIPFDPVKLSWSSMQIFYICMYYIILSVPFFFTGLIVATVLASLSEKAGLFYSADLLGAGLGSLGVLFFMTIFKPDTTVFILSIFALAGAFIAGGNRLKAISFMLILIVLAIVSFRPEIMKLKMSQYKGLKMALRYPGAEHLKTYVSPFSVIDTIKSPAVRFAPGMSLLYLDELPEQIGLSIDGGSLHAITGYGDQASLTFLSYLPSALPYMIVSPSLPKGMDKLSNVIIIDPKGCLQCLVAQHYGFSSIYKIESNPLIVKIINKDFKEFSGGIYSQNTWSGLGRAWLSTHRTVFDIIDIPLTGTDPSGTFGISEDYRLTVEAFQEYFSHLKPDGMISINLFIIPPLRTELRIFTTAITAMKESGIKENQLRQHFAAIRSWGSICIIIKRSPFNSHEVNKIKEFSRDRRFDLIYYPGIQEEETNIYVRMPSNEYFKTVQTILNPEKRKEFIDDYIFDLKPVRDENPFFHYYLKLRNIREIYTIMGKKWQYFIEQGYILPVVLIQVFALSFFLILLPAFSRKNKSIISSVIARRSVRLTKQSQSPETKNSDEIASSRLFVETRNDKGGRFLPYFAFLGIGFMFVEVSFIHKMIFTLEHPSYSIATVLTSILISSGIGSLFSYRIMALRSNSITFILSLLIVTYSLLIPFVSGFVSPYNLLLKILLVFFILLPLGFFMGIPFPAGLRTLGEKNESLIPWAWAINGCLSVLAPILTVMLALTVGFKTVLWLGALAYLMAFITLQRFMRKSL